MLEQLYGGVIHPRRVRALAAHIAGMLPPSAKVLDVGCGDGRLARAVLDLRSDLSIRGLDVLVRQDAFIPVDAFDGRRIPGNDREFDIVIFADVLHHTTNGLNLLKEGTRAARVGVVIKDHLLQGLFARATLVFMDWVGNARHGVALPYNYWTPQQWKAAFVEVKLKPAIWRTHLGLYPPPAHLIFERAMHFLTLLKHDHNVANA